MKFAISGAIVAAGLCLGATSTAVQAQEVRYLAGNCANCHGTDGRQAAGSAMPALAGLSRTHFIEQMNAFRSGARQATIMHQIAKGYSDDQIAKLADYFAGLKPAQ